VEYSDSGVVIEEDDIKEGDIHGYRKIYKNGILVALGFYQGGMPAGIHYFWDDKGILKQPVTYRYGKVEAVKEY
jgi:antitoxin component YwqK of YwqJK toxin-antitoxin module